MKLSTGGTAGDILKIALGSGLIGLASSPGGILGAGLSIGAGYVDKKWIAKGSAGEFLWYFSILNAMDMVMDSVVPRGVIG